MEGFLEIISEELRPSNDHMYELATGSPSVELSDETEAPAYSLSVTC